MDYYGPMTSLARRLIPSLFVANALLAVFSAHAQEAPSKPAPVLSSAMDGQLFYQLLVGEMNARGGDNAAAFQIILDAARRSGNAQVYERAIELALRSRSGDSALQAAQAWARAQPSSREANRYVLQILLGLNRLQEAVEPLRREVALTPAKERAAVISQLPRNFARTNEKKLSVTVLEQALSAELANPSTGPAAWTAIGTLRITADDKRGALDAAQKGSALNPRAVEPIQLALALMDPGVPEAEALVARYMAGKPTPEMRMAYIRKLMDQQRDSDAGRQVRALTADAPDYADGWLLRGSLEAQERQPEQAKSALEKYIALSDTKARAPQSRGVVQALLLLSQLAEQAGQYPQAQAYLEQIRDPQDPMRLVARRASVLARQGKLDEARALVRAAPESNADDARLKISTEVQLLRDAQQFTAAYELLKQHTPRFQQDPDYLYELAMAAEKIGRIDEMEKLLRQVIALKPDYYNAYNALGYSLADRNIRLPEARKLIEKALELSPGDPYIVDSLAWVEYRSGNLQEALRLLRQAYKDRPDAEIAAHLGEVLWSLNERSQAKVVWDEGRKLNPDNETLKDTVRRLLTP